MSGHPSAVILDLPARLLSDLAVRTVDTAALVGRLRRADVAGPVTARLRGRGPLVLVGGLATSERLLGPMAGWLGRLGYDVTTFTERAGVDCGARTVTRLGAVVDEVQRRDVDGDGVAVVGFSRGGQFARAVAATRPLRALVTLGSPFDLWRVGPVAVGTAAGLTLLGTLGLPGLPTAGCLWGRCCADYRTTLRRPVRAPFTSIYSRADAVVPWRSSHDPGASNVEITGGHLDLLGSEVARQAVAAALAGTAELPAGAACRAAVAG